MGPLVSEPCLLLLRLVFDDLNAAQRHRGWWETEGEPLTWKEPRFYLSGTTTRAANCIQANFTKITPNYIAKNTSILWIVHIVHHLGWMKPYENCFTNHLPTGQCGPVARRRHSDWPATRPGPRAGLMSARAA